VSTSANTRNSRTLTFLSCLSPTVQQHQQHWNAGRFAVWQTTTEAEVHRELICKPATQAPESLSTTAPPLTITLLCTAPAPVMSTQYSNLLPNQMNLYSQKIDRYVQLIDKQARFFSTEKKHYESAAIFASLKWSSANLFLQRLFTVHVQVL